MTFSRRALLAGAALAAVITAPGAALAAQPTNIWASSTLYENGFDHSASNVLNYTMSLCWSEGASGTGVGESLTLQYGQRGYITQLVIGPGFLKSEDLFYQNCYPTKILLESGGSSVVLDLESYAWNYDACLQGITCTFDQPIWVDGTVQLTILAVREGSKWEDCCITYLDLDVTSQLEDGMNGYYINLNERDEALLGNIAQWVYERENWYPSSIVAVNYNMANVSIATKAFVLYAYVYHSSFTDPRVSYGDGMNWVSEADLYAMAQQLFGPDQCQAIVQGYIDAYSMDYSNGYVYTSGTGDFGAAGAVLFDNPANICTQNGQLVVTGNVRCYDSSAGGYVNAGTWEARYGITSASQTVGTYYGVQVGSEGFPFKLESLVVTPNGYQQQPAATSTPATTVTSSGYTHATTSSTTYVEYPAESPEPDAYTYTEPEATEVDVYSSLYQKAVNYCSVMYGVVPDNIDIAYDGDGIYAIHVYDIVDNHTATWNWFYVDETGVGYDIVYSSIDLNV